MRFLPGKVLLNVIYVILQYGAACRVRSATYYILLDPKEHLLPFKRTTTNIHPALTGQLTYRVIIYRTYLRVRL